eukprot:scaffold318552_cov28-Tisochrysis_lutea.AAC.1
MVTTPSPSKVKGAAPTVKPEMVHLAELGSAPATTRSTLRSRICLRGGRVSVRFANAEKSCSPVRRSAARCMASTSSRTSRPSAHR